MTKSSWLFLCLALTNVLLGLNTLSQEGQTTAFIASGIFASLFVVTLIVGRRIKFDPVLR